MTSLTDSEFGQFQRFIFQNAGITLTCAKKALVSGRLAKRLHACQVNSYGDYFRLLVSGHQPQEVQTAIDLLTTNETYFFREPKHFQFLRQYIMSEEAPSAIRVWSAAGSTGEEAYSIAMLLEDCLPRQPWEVLASDISTRVLERARRGHYSMDRLEQVPPGYLQRFCLQGRGDQAGTLLVERSIRSRVRFLQVNLNTTLPRIGTFDVIFLRNVMIYFNLATKRKVVERVLAQLRPGGYLMIGHSESLLDVNETLELVAPATYRKPGRG
jgi:chemotaxis protein methyltransferase CheR